VCFGTVAAVLLVYAGRSIFLLGLLADLVALILYGLYLSLSEPCVQNEESSEHEEVHAVCWYSLIFPAI